MKLPFLIKDPCSRALPSRYLLLLVGSSLWLPSTLSQHCANESCFTLTLLSLTGHFVVRIKHSCLPCKTWMGLSQACLSWGRVRCRLFPVPEFPGNKAAVAGWGLCVLWQGICPCQAFISSAMAVVRSLSIQFVPTDTRSSGRKRLRCG